MAQLLNDMTKFIDKEELDELISSLARQIENDYMGNEILVICPLKGSVLFAADLMRKINLTQKIDFVQLSSPKGESVRIIKDVSEDLYNKHVIIVEEIIDVGRTLSFLVDRVRMAKPASVKVVTLLDKPARRELPITPDYVGKTIEDRYVVGYGMDSEEVGRNYSDIYIFRQ